MIVRDEHVGVRKFSCRRDLGQLIGDDDGDGCGGVPGYWPAVLDVQASGGACVGACRNASQSEIEVKPVADCPTGPDCMSQQEIRERWRGRGRRTGTTGGGR